MFKFLLPFLNQAVHFLFLNSHTHKYLIHFYFMFMGVGPSLVPVHHLSTCCLWMPKEGSDFMELEIHKVVRRWVLRMESRYLARAASRLDS